MRMAATALMVLAGAQAAAANDCAARIAGLLTGSLDPQPTRARIVTETKGQPAVENEMLMRSWEHYLYKPVSPQGPWLLTFDGVTYQSADEGGSWTKAYEFDKEETRRTGIAMVEGQAASIRNAVCGEEKIDGVVYDTLRAAMTNPPPHTFEISSQYWVEKATGFVARAETLMKSESFESLTRQNWQPAPDLELPLPK